ncbi:MAG: hypothetical protein ACXVAE_06155 [Candidatus Limnocylindrales bacterium]
MPGRARLGLLSCLLVLTTAACSSSVASVTPGGSTQAPPTALISSAPTELTSPTPAGSPGTPTPAPTAAASPDVSVPLSAEACTGKDENKAFFGAVAAQMHWDVYCAVLPAGWYLDYAHYDLAAGGQLTASYKGPGGVHLQLLEGNTCTDPSVPCQPKVSEIGATLYGDRTGTLYTLAPGHAIYVGPANEPPSWAAASVDLDEVTFVKLVASLHKVAP